MRYLSFLLLLPALGLFAPSSPAQTLQFNQTDFEFNGILTPDSDWGSVDLTFTGTSGELYFNLSVNGTWQVQDVPILSGEGPGILQTTTLAFSLGVPTGTDVSSLNYGFTLTPAPTGVMPPSALTAPVTPASVVMYSSGDPAPFPTGPAPAVPDVGNGAAPVGRPQAHHRNFPNQQSPPNCCLPTAVSNSLKFLNRENGLGLSDAATSIDSMKTVCGFVDGVGCDGVFWWQQKDIYMIMEGYPITTKQVKPADIATIIQEIQNGQDVEMDIYSHEVAVWGIKDLGGGKYRIYIKHDANQNDDVLGLQTGSSTFDTNTGKFTSGLLTSYFGIYDFVVECPDPPPAPTTCTPYPPPAPGGTVITPGAGPDLPAIPADFFGPGSDPFDGLIPMVCSPLDPEATGNAAVFVNIFGRPSLKCREPWCHDLPFIPVEATSGAIVGELESSEPIVVGFSDGETESWGVKLQIDGAMTEELMPKTHFDRTHENGGQFWGSFVVRPRLTFTRLSDGETRIFNPYELDPSTPPIELSFSGPWVYDVEPSLELVAPDDGFFVWGVDELAPGDPLSQVAVPVTLASADGTMVLQLWPAQTGVSDTPELPETGLFAHAYPNPFNPGVTIEYRLPRAGRVDVSIFTVRGELVRVLRDREAPEGVGTVEWDGTSDDGRRVDSGVYLFRVSSGGMTTSGKVTLLK